MSNNGDKKVVFRGKIKNSNSPTEAALFHSHLVNYDRYLFWGLEIKSRNGDLGFWLSVCAMCTLDLCLFFLLTVDMFIYDVWVQSNKGAD